MTNNNLHTAAHATCHAFPPNTLALATHTAAHATRHALPPGGTEQSKEKKGKKAPLP